MFETLILAGVVCQLLCTGYLLWRSKKQHTPPEDTRFVQLKTQLELVERNIKDLAKELRAEHATSRQELGLQLGENRKEQAGTLHEGFLKMKAELSALQQASSERLERLRAVIQERLESLQKDNGQRLEKMQGIVDEKLQSTLEKRISESFKLVSTQLDQVAKGLGEVHALSSGVTDLRRVMSNIKTRGGWGEVQLGALLEQVLAPNQYAKNVHVIPGADSVVEYAVLLPGKQDGAQIYLPIDAKFPAEDYTRFLVAVENGDKETEKAELKQLLAKVKEEAKKIKTKYVKPPHTTDFGIMFLPTEGLYAEVLRDSGLTEQLQRESKVIIAGPTTLLAILNSLQMGFQTLAIQRSSSHIWEILTAVKSEFADFGVLLGKAREKMDSAASSLEKVEKHTLKIQKKLKNVESLPTADVDDLPLLPDSVMFKE